MMNSLKTLSFGAAAVIVTVLVAATILEKLCGSAFAIENIYHSWWFITLWALLAVAATAYILRTQRRGSLILLHASFVLVLLGAFVSFLTSKRGDMAISEDGVPASMFESGDGALERLPFRLQLAGVDTLYTDGAETPSDYVVRVVADGKAVQAEYVISLNAPAKIDGYQFCIKGVNGAGVSLLVSHDPYGRPISYAGYLMVFVSFLLLFFDRQSGFHALLLQIKGVERKGESGKVPVKKERDAWSLGILARRMWVALPVSFLFLCVLWYGRGVFPATNGAEALMLLVLFVMLLAVALGRNKRFVLLSRLLVVVAAMFFVVAAIGLNDNSDVQPILRTPLLGIHVTTIIIAYALLACTAVNAVVALCTKDEKRKAQQALLGRLLLYPATMLLACGIFIGAVWANLSWGRYWGWDPKEVWALVTLLVCSMGFHSHSLRFISKPVAFHIFCIVAFLAVLFTFFGVNWLLGGLHSYA
ncbi:MAG: cytochrome c biogenesis protein CcsA [Bacteroidaceae bacterium]|nr:cytochrome c biogenesis protein CcsA [Bacteroidaceae bacterium]